MTYTVAYADGRQEVHEPPRPQGTFGILLHYRRVAKEERERLARAERVEQLARTIAELEAWHHAWRLEHDEDYRKLHPDEWCDGHGQPRSKCKPYFYGCEPSSRRSWRPDPMELFTWSGHVIRTAGVQESALTLEERRRATRRIAAWAAGVEED
jgi:hypothetical protein